MLLEFSFVSALGFGLVGLLVVGLVRQLPVLSNNPWLTESLETIQMAKLSRISVIFGGMGLVWLYGGVEFFLVALTVSMTTIALADKFYFQSKRQGKPSQLEFVTFSRESWLVLLGLIVVRSFVIQHYRVPTGSLEPTVKPGDFLLVNQFAYGWHLPITNTKLLNWGQPKRGDIAVFRYPNDPYKILYVKRVIGVPGDHIVYSNKHLTINGQVIKHDYVGMETDQSNTWNPEAKMSKRIEYLPERQHEIYVSSNYGPYDEVNLVVPKGTYFMMGDNRDRSQDSRFFGPVSEDLLVGRAMFVIFGWDGWWPTWKRTGLML